jgi:hypothetical protein
MSREVYNRWRSRGGGYDGGDLWRIEMNRSTAAVLLLALCALSLPLAGAAPAMPKAAPVLTPERVHFMFEGLAKSVRGETRPALPLPPEPEPGLGAEAANVRFHFDDDKLPDYVDSSHRQVVIYDAPAFRELFVKAGQGKGNPVDALRALLKKGTTAVPGELPILPPPDAAQVLKARVRLVPFHGGKGFAFVTSYSQDTVPVANDALVYTFQGLTDDGRYWVAVYYPISASILPKTVQESPEAKNYKAFDAHFQTYLKKTVRALEDPKTVYTPDLGTLDALVRSLEIRG